MKYMEFLKKAYNYFGLKANCNEVLLTPGLRDCVILTNPGIYAGVVNVKSEMGLSPIHFQNMKINPKSQKIHLFEMFVNSVFAYYTII